MTFSGSQKPPGRPQALRNNTCARFSIRSRFTPALCALAVCVLLVSCGGKTDRVPPPQALGTNAAPVAVAVSPELAKLVGKWERPNGGYILEIKSVDPSGKLEVGYFNPDPINVSRAVAWRENGTSKVIIELQDVNYPGCTYSLEHNPQSDQLFGQYYQAAMQQTFEVVFTRVK
jgi:hypothetical protein